MLKSYHSRLIFYSVILMMFLTGLVSYSYLYIYDLVINETKTHISRLAQFSVSSLTEERHELERYAEIIAKDLRVREYMFIVTQIGSKATPLRELYDRNFSSLPIDSIFIVDKNKKLIVGDENVSNDYVQKHFPSTYEDDAPYSFYLNDPINFEFVAVAKITYRDSVLGYIAITRHIDNTLLQKLRKKTGGHIFISHNNTILNSSLDTAINKPFILDKNQLDIADELYLTHELKVSEEKSDLPQIWLGLPETQLIERLTEHRGTILTILVTGVIAILFVGVLLIRNFHQPLSALMKLTREIGKGNFPLLKKTLAQNEIDELGNHFVDMVTALKEKQEEINRVHEALKQSAITDSLTGLHNRRYLQMIFPKMLAQANREHKYLGAIIIDIDHFKKINDTYGHLAGDICLATFSDDLRAASRANDDLFRMGGEEFLILTISDDTAGIKSFAEKLRATIENETILYQNQEISITISVGISIAPQHGNEQEILNQLLAQADEALYKAKKTGRNQVVESAVVPHNLYTSRQQK